jgi:hypothetical protein
MNESNRFLEFDVHGSVYLGNIHVLFKVQIDLLVFFIYLIVSSTCFGCYLQPSSGAQLQRTAIGVSVENRGYSIKWCGGVFCMD